MRARERESEVRSRGPVLALLVDDNPDVRELYAVALPCYGIRVETAENGREALDKAHQLLPDVIVMDLCMPGLDGDVVASLLRTDPVTRPIPLIAVSAHGFAARLRARTAGFDDFCAKPCIPGDLVRVIESVLPSRLADSQASGG